MEVFYKATAADGRAFAGKGVWQPGKWRIASTPLIPCQRGIHYCNRDQIVGWLNAELWLFEVADGAETVDAGDKLVCSKGRIVERVETWNETTARLFAADCAEQALKFIPEMHQAPFSAAINAARDFARGEINDAQRDAAARDAARAAGAAARAAARAAAWAAAWAAGAAGAAARAAAGAAARAAGAAAWAAAGAAARSWQTERLFDYLEGRAS